MILRTRADSLGGLWCGIEHHRDHAHQPAGEPHHRHVVQPNKAIVGRNAFAHEAGIHQHGVLTNPLTYEIMDPASVGLAQSEIVLGKHSGRHALRNALDRAGLRARPDELDQAFARFKELADRKGRISAADLEAIVGDEMRVEAPRAGFSLEELHFAGGTGDEPRGARGGASTRRATAPRPRPSATGPSTPLMKAIDAAAGSAGELLEYHVSAVTSGKDALGEARVVCDIDGRRVRGPVGVDRRPRGERASPTCEPSTRAATPSTASASAGGCLMGQHAVREGLGRPRRPRRRARRRRRSSTSTCTWSTRSPRRRPSTACG